MRRTGRRGVWPPSTGSRTPRWREIWRAFGLKPWREDEFKVSPDPELVEKIRDLVALYMNPPVAAAVFAVDEKPQIQALNRTAPTLPMLPTTPARATHDYERNGTCDLFAALEIATGKVITDIRARHTSADFVAFLNKVNRDVPAGLDVHVILDNLSTHKTPTVHKWLLRHRRFHFHFTPTYGSWMNLVERWFSALTTKKLQRSAHRSVKDARRRHPSLGRPLEREPHPVRLAQDRRTDPRTPRRLLRRHQPRATRHDPHQFHGASTFQDTRRSGNWAATSSTANDVNGMPSSTSACLNGRAPPDARRVRVTVLVPSGSSATRR